MVYNMIWSCFHDKTYLFDFEFRIMEQWISAFLTISITSHVFKRVINIETTFPNSGHHWENLPRLIPIFTKHPPKVPIPISTKLPSPIQNIIGKTFRAIFPKHPSKVPIPISIKLPSPFCTHFCKIFANFLRTLLADHNALVYI